ncbi:hypothetical protein [Deinococcus aquaticus]|uniref:hypothetical protein n=1 Tax=Deinococcus aquaticus TaxID=328692 RepID=UPI003F46F1C5
MVTEQRNFTSLIFVGFGLLVLSALLDRDEWGLEFFVAFVAQTAAPLIFFWSLWSSPRPHHSVWRRRVTKGLVLVGTVVLIVSSVRYLQVMSSALLRG